MIPQDEHTFNSRRRGRPDLPSLAQAITAHLERAGAERQHGGELVFRCPAPGHEDRNPSASWNAGKGLWCCHSRGCHEAHGGGGALPLAALLGIDVDAYRTAEAEGQPGRRRAAAASQGGTGPTKAKGQAQDAPAAAVAAPAATYAGLADFEDRRDLPAGYLASPPWNVAEGRHAGRPALLWPTLPGMPSRVKFLDGRGPTGHGSKYTWKGKGGRVHIYGLPLALERLTADSAAPLYVVNGEPSTWAAAAAGLAVVCFAGGEGTTKPAPELAEALATVGRPVAVRVAYDADTAGQAGGPKVAAALKDLGLDVAALDLAAWPGWQDAGGMPDGADVGDLAQAARPAELAAALAALPRVEAEGAAAEGKDAAERESQAAALVRIGKTTELFCDEDGRAYATIDRGGLQETHAIKGASFRRWLVFAYSKEQGGRVPTASTVADALNVLEGCAAYADDAKVLPVHVRYAEHEERIYVDLGGQDWRAVEVSADGWRVVSRPPVRFRRAKAMAALPEPERGGSLALLRDFVNLTPEDWPLFLGWLVCAMRPRGPYPVLVLGGEQGSSKSTIMKVAKRLVDPSTAPLRAEPKEARDLMISANNGWCLAFDNLDRVEPWLSNALCRMATGGGFSVRTNYADDEETIFQATRPVALNGIGDVATRPDLLERSLTLAPPTIPESRRQSEADFWRGFGRSEGRIFGALLDALSTALRQLPATRLDALPRMADAALWVAAAEPSLGHEPGDFAKALKANRERTVDLALEASPIAAPLRRLVDARSNQSWTGTMGDLLIELQVAVAPHERAPGWPKGATGLAAAVRRIAPALRELGFKVTQNEREHGGRRPWTIAKHDLTKLLGGEPSPPSPPSKSPENRAETGDTGDSRGLLVTVVPPTGDGSPPVQGGNRHHNRHHENPGGTRVGDGGDGCDTFPPKSFVAAPLPGEILP